MVFRRTYASRRQGTRGGRKPAPRRRAGIRTRVRYQRPNARNQRAQIASLARMAVRNSRILNMSKIYCDWYQQESDVDYNPTTSFAIPLTDIAAWQNGSRSSQIVDRAPTTYLREMMFNYFVTADRMDTPMFLSMFIVSLRSTAVGNPIPNPLKAAGTQPVPPGGYDYTSQGSQCSIILNSAKYKVLWTRFFHLFPWNQSPLNAGDEPIPYGNPMSSYRRGRVRLRLGWNMKSLGIVSKPWHDFGINDLAPSRRLYLICASYAPSGDGVWNLSWAIKVTSINDN